MSAGALALLARAALGCSEPQVVSPTEASLDVCRNGLDDDGNGLTDCEDQSCIAGGFCASFDAPCSVLPAEGCPRGMACYANENDHAGSRCAVPGPKGAREPCEGAGSCRAGLHCLGVCLTTCLDSSMCGRDTFCVRDEDWQFGVCSVPCIPSLAGSGCRAGTCVTSHEFGGSFDGNQMIAFCADRPSWQGTVAEGERCDDPPSISKLSGMCAPGLVCVPLPDGSGPVCHSTCGLSDTRPVAPCRDPKKRCIPAFPLDDRPAEQTAMFAGLCVTP